MFKAKRILNCYYLYICFSKFFKTAAFITFVIFLQRHGLGSIDRNLVNSFYMVTIVLLEIPTGIIADVFGRRLSLLCAQVFFMAGGLIYFFSDQIIFFICAEIMVAIGFTCQSGALFAWVIDSLDHYQYQYNRQEIASISHMLSQVFSILGGLVGAYLGTLDQYASYPWLMWGLGHAFMIIFVYIFIKEPYYNPKFSNLFEGLKYAYGIYKISRDICLQSYGLKLNIAIFACFSMACQSINMLWSIKYAKGLGLIGLSIYVFIPMSLLILFGGYLAKRTSGSAYKVQLFSISIIYIGFCIAGAAYGTLLPSIIMFCLHEIGRGFYVPVRSAMIQDQLDDYLSNSDIDIMPTEIRATIKSIDSMGVSFGSAVGLLVLGQITKSASISTSWYLSSILFIIIGIVYWILARKK